MWQNYNHGDVDIAKDCIQMTTGSVLTTQHKKKTSALYLKEIPSEMKVGLVVRLLFVREATFVKQSLKKKLKLKFLISK